MAIRSKGLPYPTSSLLKQLDIRREAGCKPGNIVTADALPSARYAQMKKTQQAVSIPARPPGNVFGQN